MSEIKQRALEKMNAEMSQKHSRSIDSIHNWLCEQEDDDLFEKICQEGKTIADAYQYCRNKSSEYRDEDCAMVSDDIVFGWVVDYFKSSLQEVKETYLYSSKGTNDKKHAEKKETPKNNVKTSQKEKEKADFERISLFEL
ncbi:Cas9 inhibitor AcrIIA9 family protein [Solobacterium moorei]|uniref:Cas9 inhibitor AcrIIA9 family protein n=1 Tax=Solobacterium moorei TaxID=102148 RepID=UPI000401B292|nr:Cas9 inhibitor AcrIIA9 family protein [Solobacterium moorei]BET22330.1 Cas9 inhibitor AcrIIA9 family protein [Solobacterium moorei]